VTTLLLFNFIDILGTFVFALSGAIAAKDQKLDIFGIFIVAFITACGGVIRDILLGRVPVVLRKEVYGSAAMLGSLIVIVAHFFKFDSTVGAWTGIVVCFVIRYI